MKGFNLQTGALSTVCPGHVSHLVPGGELASWMFSLKAERCACSWRDWVLMEV